jgi:hypothetical protein
MVTALYAVGLEMSYFCRTYKTTQGFIVNETGFGAISRLPKGSILMYLTPLALGNSEKKEKPKNGIEKHKIPRGMNTTFTHSEYMHPK